MAYLFVLHFNDVYNETVQVVCGPVFFKVFSACHWLITVVPHYKLQALSLW